jgi:2,3-bisphosphoglycerate-independent phosphoglycerate mutase
MKSNGCAALAGAVKAQYEKGTMDYFLKPMALADADGKAVGKVANGDEVIFTCRRGEREIELTEAFTDPDFKAFDRPYLDKLHFSIMTMYHEKFKQLPIAFAPEKVVKPVAQIISEAGLKQFHCSESEKFAHVTFFFNGGENTPFPGETDTCVPSPKGIAFDSKPELSLPEVEGKVIDAVNEGYDFIVANFANGDVIGHTANTGAKLSAAAFISHYASEAARYAKEKGYLVAITADHGNIETLFDKKGKPHVAHTQNLVPFIVLDPKERSFSVKDGVLCDVAPTILSVLGLEQPEEMTGTPLIPAEIRNRKMFLLILDGWGYGSGDENDAIHLADTTEWDALLEQFPNSRLHASGEYVGLQGGKPGNSEAGHTNLGAGRIVPQDDVRMDRAVASGEFEKNKVFLDAITRAKQSGCALHLISYLTKKSSHGSIDYSTMLVRMAKNEGLDRVFLHIIFDGRSTEPGSGPDLLSDLGKELDAIGCGMVVDGVGRGIALDRDHDYEKIQRTYENLVAGMNGLRYTD